MKRVFSILVLFCYATGLVQAQNTPSNGTESIVFDPATQRGFQSLTSALTVLTTDDSVTGGTFSLEDPDGEISDADIDVLKLWNEIPLLEQDAQFLPLLEFNLAYLRFEQGGSVGKADVDNWALGAGVGLKIALLDEVLWLTPRFKIEYADYDFKIRFDDVDQALIDAVIPDIYTWTYLPSLELMFQPKVENLPGRLSIGSRLSYIYVDAQSSKSSLSDFYSESWVMRNVLAFEAPLQCVFTGHEFFMRPLLARVDVYGDARDGFGLNNFYETGVDVLSRNLLSNIFSELGFGFRYVFEDEISGWRLGLFGDFS